MKGRQATGQAEATEFVICKDGYLWSAPRGRFAKWFNGWTTNINDAEVYKSWKAADAAIERYRASGKIGFLDAQYCSLKEFKEMAKYDPTNN